MYQFLKIQYRLGKIGEIELQIAVTKGLITIEQKTSILNGN